MAGQGIISPQRNELLEKTIDGASLIYDSVEAHNCEQLERWLKCHGRPQKGKKSELIERVKNAIRNHVPVDPTVDKGKWLNIINTLNQSPNVQQSYKINYPNILQPFPSDKVPKNFTYGSMYHYLVTSCIDDDYDDSDIENCGSNNQSSKVDYSTSKPLKRGKLYVESGHVFEILEGVTPDQMFCMKCKIQASYKAKEIHQVSVMINPSTARIIHGTCDCKTSSMGRCSHVAALLYVLLNYLDDCDEDNVPCTSKVCSWNQGRKRKEPHKADEQQYTNKNDMSKRRSYDPGRSLTRPIDKRKINNLLSDLQLINASRKSSFNVAINTTAAIRGLCVRKTEKKPFKDISLSSND
ncbi:uncharacterized protein LOC123274130 isoform X1 [Cotesia glomerata]|uniref:uncharacterized protein LOC123274130 isoform X1 n=1 Tax=Cotesia glomerata TaxID=32391 RepID=UPI001D01505C|nr:uncharacterized protein LOC123274130 isoform X1 [Cotesia glomerata]